MKIMTLKRFGNGTWDEYESKERRQVKEAKCWGQIKGQTVPTRKVGTLTKDFQKFKEEMMDSQRSGILQLVMKVKVR